MKKPVKKKTYTKPQVLSMDELAKSLGECAAGSAACGGVCNAGADAQGGTCTGGSAGSASGT